MLKSYQFIGIWKIDIRLIVPPSKNHKIPENIWYFKACVNAVSTHTPQISQAGSKFYEYCCTRLWHMP